MKHNPSDRTARLAQSDIRAMTLACAKVKGINMSQGVCDTPVPPVVIQAAKAAMDQGHNIYSRFDEADGGYLPFGHRRFDRLYAANVIDLIPTSLIPIWLQGFRRVLKPGRCMVLLTLTEGVTMTSRAVVSLWKAAYRLYPLACGGCRPLQLTDDAASWFSIHAG